MKFVCHFYIYILISILTKKIHVVQCTSDFEFRELQYLSEKLEPTECLKLLDGAYNKITLQEKSTQLESLQKGIQKHLETSWVTQKDCFYHLQNWHDNFPGEGNIEGRKIIEDVLSSLERSDLVEYLKKNQRRHFLDHLNRFEKFFENNEYDQRKRYGARNEKELNQNKYPRGNELSANNQYHKFDLDEIDSNNVRPIQDVVNGEIVIENFDRRDQDAIKSKREKKFDFYWIILITSIALVIMLICGSGIFFIYRKHCDRCVNGRLCQEWALSRESQKINVCCCGSRKETSRKAYSDVDMESGWSRKCSKCWLDPKGDNNEKSRLKQETTCVQKLKKLRKKKTHPKTREKFHKKEEKKVSRNKYLEKEMKSRKCQRSAISEPSRTDYKGMQNKIASFPKNKFKCYQCNCTSEEFIVTTKKDKKKEKSGWSSGWISPQLKGKRIKESKNTEKLFQYDSSSPCSRKACEWRKIAKEKRHGKNSV